MRTGEKGSFNFHTAMMVGDCKLSEDKLNESVILWREEEAVTNIEADRLEDDYYIDKERHEDGCFTLSDVIFDEEGRLEKVYDKGYPILWENF